MDWLLAVGCSLTWGSETTEPKKSLPQDKENAYPKHLADILNIRTVINKSEPGKSNGSIYRVAQEELIKCYQQRGSNGLLVVQWSGLARLEIANPFVIDIPHFFKNIGITHPGFEGPFLSLTPNEILDEVSALRDQLPHVAEYFVGYWAHDFYQQEMLVNHSISLSSLAEKLGVKILQFNGIDEFNPAALRSEIRYIKDAIGKDWKDPTSRKDTFWYTYRPESADYGNGFRNMPTHPTIDEHKDWAKKLYQHLKTVYPTI